ncbi:MAG TPA: FAD-dependent oxidoreductase [Vicinamibacterales bacterium]|nr:FAD-dependent oxidoreductase [Vicinamibacterales bacterium]
MTTTGTVEYDAAIVSASPLGLSEALMLTREGRRVVVCDRRAHIGGAWRTETALGYRDVEVGCHIFIPGIRVGIALQTLWGVQLAPLTPPPQTVYRIRGRHLQGAYLSPLLDGVVNGIDATRTVMGVFERPQRGTWRSAFDRYLQSASLLRRAVRSRFAAPGPLLYPPAGTAAIVRALAERVATAGVELRLRREATSVVVDSNGASLTLDDGTFIRARQLIITRGSAIESINGLALPRRRLVRRHWVVVLDDPAPKAFSYLQFHRHPAIERVSDVTSFARRLDGRAVESGRKIVCFYVNNALYEQGRSQAQYVLLHTMKQRRWIGQDAAVIADGWWEDHESSYDHRLLGMLQDANPALRVIREINLGAFLVNNLHRITTAAAAPLPSLTPGI